MTSDRSTYNREYYQRNKATINKRVALNNKRIKERNHNHVRAHLAEHPCVDCGERDIVVLEFDHVRGTKRNDISELIRKGVSLQTLQTEIDKCDVRCANCHRRQTHKRRQHLHAIGDAGTTRK